MKNADKLYLSDKLFRDLPFQASNHDYSKFQEPELTPYIVLTQYYALKQKGIELKTDDSIRDRIRNAVFHHLKNNSHHPEYWDNNIQPLTKGERSKQVVNATTMPVIDLAEMVCDWKAMSQELNDSVEEFAKSVIGKKFIFSPEQVALIHNCIFLLKE
jgi:hypothetical protein